MPDKSELARAIEGAMDALSVDLWHRGAHYGNPPTVEEFAASVAARLSSAAASPTHGRHCPCSACAREDWTNPGLASCGMHGGLCPDVYAPIPTAASPKAALDVERLARALAAAYTGGAPLDHRYYQQAAATVATAYARLAADAAGGEP